jgi:acetylornithine deacetylase/succinyl-diaminopimelate desuccinylase-like protein
VPPDPSKVCAVVEHLQAIERPSASDGERRAAEWIRDRFVELGGRARVEQERATGSFALPVGLLSALAAAAGLSRAARPDADETVVFVAHHDAARGGLIFHPGPTRWVADTFPAWCFETVVALTDVCLEAVRSLSRRAAPVPA